MKKLNAWKYSETLISMKKNTIFTLQILFQILLTELAHAITFANKMQYFQETQKPHVKVGFLHLIRVINTTLNANATRNITTRNVDVCTIECFMAIPTCFGLNFVRIMGNTSDSNCELYQEEVVIYDLVQNENVDHYALENPCLTLPCHNGGTCIRNVTLDTYTCKCAFFYSGTNCDKYGEMKPVRNNIIRVLPLLKKTWSLSIDIKPIRLTEDWSNVVHATIKEDMDIYGDRTPGIWFNPKSLRLFIASSVNGKTNYNINTHSIPLNEYTSVNVSQILIGNDYVFSIFINSSKIHEVVNNDVREFKDVKLYASDPWFVEANVLIKI